MVGRIRRKIIWVVWLCSLPVATSASADELNALQAIFSRSSVRAYDDKPVSNAKLRKIMDAGWRASTVDGSRPFEFVVIRERETLEQLAGVTKFAKWMPKAPAAIAVLTRRNLSPNYHIENGIQAVANMYYAAKEQGLGTCFVGTGERSKMKRILGFTGKRYQGRHLLTLLPIGYPKAGKKHKSPSRVPLTETVSDGRFGRALTSLKGSRVLKDSKLTMGDLLYGSQESVTAFSKVRVGKNRLRTALECMRVAQSSKNRQPWRVVLVRDEATKKQIAKASNDRLLAQAPVIAVLATSLKPPPVRFGTQEQHDPHNDVKPGTRLTRHFIRKHDPAFALANLRMGLQSVGLGARVTMLDAQAENVARKVLSSSSRPIGLRNMHIMAAVGIGHVSATRGVRIRALPRSRVSRYRPRRRAAAK